MKVSGAGFRCTPHYYHYLLSFINSAYIAIILVFQINMSFESPFNLTRNCINIGYYQLTSQFMWTYQSAFPSDIDCRGTCVKWATSKVFAPTDYSSNNYYTCLFQALSHFRRKIWRFFLLSLTFGLFCKHHLTNIWQTSDAFDITIWITIRNLHKQIIY